MHVASRDSPQSLEFWEDCRPSGSYRFSLHSWLDRLLSDASAGNLFEQGFILHGPLAEQCDGFGELVAGRREAVV
jgi:hypothetical protein